MFGKNPFSGLLLKCLDLTEADCGRFRDCYVEDGMICVYTRNGGGNRECWHEDDPEWGNEKCKHETYQEEVDEVVELPVEEGEASGYKRTSVTTLGSGVQRFYTGKRVMETRYRCLSPNSKECGCPGCIIEHRLPEHPNYIKDEDDDFDSTYATIYFRIPDQYKETLRDTGDLSGEEKWNRLFKALGVKP